MATTNDTNDTNQATFEEFETEDENEEFDYDAGTRADSAMSGCLKVEKGEHSEAGYRVHSGSGETYAVDLRGPDGYFCQCEDRADVCKHIMRVLLENPSRLPRSESEPELVTDGGEETETPEFPMRDGVPCPHRMSAAIELALRWEIEYEEAKAFLQGIGFYGDAGGDDENAGKELVTDGGQEIHRDYRSGSKLSGELTDEFGSLETHSSSGDRFVVSHEGFMGDKITELAAKHGFRVAYIGTALVEFTRIEGHHTDPRTDAGEGENAGKEIVTDGGREFGCSVCDAPMEFERVRDGNDGPVVESEEFRCDNGHRGVRNYGPLGHFIQSINLKESSGGKELITDGGIDLPPICPVEPERRNEHDEPICDECGMVVVDRENSEFGGACLCQGCRDGYYNELEREFGEELISGGD